MREQECDGIYVPGLNVINGIRVFDGDRLDSLLDAVRAERIRQCNLRDSGRFPFTPADPGMTDANRLASIVEEIGEVARALMERSNAVNDKHGAELRKELTQVAALCVAWLEHLFEVEIE